MQIFTIKTHSIIYFSALILAFASLPFSNFSLSVSIIVLAANWLLQGEWDIKFLRLKSNKALLFFLLIYLTLLVGLLYTSNFQYALKDLRLKLPLLLIPLIIGTSDTLSKKQYISILTVFALSVFVASIYSTYLYIDNYNYGSSNVRDISPFISHIRLSLMVGLAAFIGFWLVIQNIIKLDIFYRVIIGLAALWLVAFLFILQSLTGIIAVFITALIFLTFSAYKIKNEVYRVGTLVFIGVFMLFIVLYFIHSIDRYFTRNYTDFNSLPTYTLNGNPYHHDPNAREYENGNLIWVNVCWPEMEREWNKRSPIPFNSKDKLGQPINFTALRYLTSLGYTKDSVGIRKLDRVDISLIEAGATSAVFKEKKLGIYPRLYQLFWEIDQYNNFGRISGSPFIQRLVYLRTAFRIIAQNPLVGVGTGDIIDEFYSYYQKYEPELESRFWYPSHNQFVTRFVTLGLWGGIVFIFAWFFPFINRKGHRNFLAFCFFSIVTLSMLNEDTLLTHIGISFTALFYSLLVLVNPVDE